MTKESAWEKIRKMEERIVKTSDTNEIREIYLQIVDLKREAGISLSASAPEEDINSEIKIGQVALITL